MAKLQEGLHVDFLRTFSGGVEQYLDGDWVEAQRVLEAAQELRPGDGPTQRLLRIVRSHDATPPPDWAGFSLE